MANGLLGAIANPATADVTGAIALGQQRAAERGQRERDKLAGDLLANTLTGKIGSNVDLDPRVRLSVAKEFGIDPSVKGRLDSFVGSAIAANKLVQSGMPGEAGQFLIEQADQVDAILGPGTANRTRTMGQRLISGDQQAAPQLSAIASQFGTPKRKASEVQTQVNTLRKTADTFSKEFRTVEDSFARIKAVAEKPSAAGDLALIFNFMKMLDPGSTVRESEFATAQNAAGVDEIIRNQWNRVRNGERLGVNTRADFLGQANSLFTAQQDVNDTRISEVLNRGVADQITGEQIFGREQLDAFNRRREARTGDVAPVQGFGPGNKTAGELTPAELNTLSIEELQRAREELAAQEGG